MNKLLPMICLGVALLGAFIDTAVAQQPLYAPETTNLPPMGGVDGVNNTDGGNGQGYFATAFNLPWPGRVWFSYTGVDNGLGFGTGGYFTLGGKMRLGEDYFGGRWLAEARGHIAHEQGQVFGNFGIERIITIDPAKADVGVSLWFDADGDREREFGFNYQQLGIGAYLRKEFWELAVNGYIPVGNTAHTLGNSGVDGCFFQDLIIERRGIDSALQGVDLELRLRPIQTEMYHFTFDFGPYYYQDENEGDTEVESFLGFRVRGGLRTLNGLAFDVEYNHDDRFNDTLFGRVTISSQVFGDYDPRGQDLNPTKRNDHIVVFHQDPAFLIDPDTGLPYRVLHVDNTAAAGGDGTFERPFDELADADPLQGGSSSTDDIIFVREGDGTFANYDTGITLQDRQLLLGDGSRYSIPTVNAGVEFELCTSDDGNKPILTNVTGGPVVTLADDNFVAGLTLTGDNGIITSSDGIFGANSPSGVTIRNMMIMDMADDGIDINNLGGDIEITNNMITDVDDEGISLGPTITAVGTTIDISDNIISNTGLDLAAGEQGHGISLTTVAAGGTLFRFVDNQLSELGGDGIRIFDVSGAGGNIWDINGNEIDVTGTAANSTGGEGIFIGSVMGAGDSFMFVENDVRNADLNGIFLDDITDAASSAVYIFRDNTSSLNNQDGIRLTNFDGASVLVERTTTLDSTLDPGLLLTPPAPLLFTTSENGGDGVHIANYRNALRAGSATAPGLQLEIRRHISDRNEGNGIFLESIDGNADILGVGEVFTDPLTLVSTRFGITNNLTNGIFIRNFTNSLLGASINVEPIIVNPINRTLDIDSIIAGNDGINTSAIRVELDATPANASASTLTGRITTRLNVTESIFDTNGGGITARVVGGANELQVSMTEMKEINNHRNDIVDFDSLDGASGRLTVRDNMTMVDNNRASGDFLDLNVDSQGTGLETTMRVNAVDNILTTTGAGPSIGGSGLRVNVNNNSVLDVAFTANEFDGLGSFGVTMSYSLDVTAPVNVFRIENNIFDAPNGDGMRLRTAANSLVAGAFTSNVINAVANSRGINVDAEDQSMLRLELLDNTLTDTTAASVTQDGIFVRSRNTATLLARVFGNSVDNFGGNGNRSLTHAPNVIVPPDPDWGRGIAAIKEDASTFHVLIEKNAVSNSALEGIQVLSTQNDPPLNAIGGTMTALVFDNSLIMNDLSSVITVPPGAPITPFTDKLAQRFDFFGETRNGSELCLTLHSNSSTSGYIVGEGPPVLVAGVPPVVNPLPQAANLRLEEGSNDVDVMQQWLHNNVPQTGVVGVPTTEVIFTTPAQSQCVTRFNTAVGLFTSGVWAGTPAFPTFP